jgi:hypothetical protein
MGLGDNMLRYARNGISGYETPVKPLGYIISRNRVGAQVTLNLTTICVSLLCDLCVNECHRERK